MRKTKLNLSNVVGTLLLICSLLYVFLPYHLSVKHEHYYEGKDSFAIGLVVSSITLLWLPESKVRAIIINFFNKFH